MRRILKTFLQRHPLVPLAILAIVADAVYIQAVARPGRERFLASFLPDSNGNIARVRVEGEVTGVRAPVPATRGELKYRFRLKNPRFLDENGEERETIRGSLPVIWYTPRPEKAGFAPEPGAVFNLEGKVFVRRSVADGVPKTIDDIFLVTRARATRVLSTRRDTPDGVLSRIRYSAAERITLGLDRLPEEKTLILAMTLGFRSDIPGRTLRAFRKAGTIHIFAISGLHVLFIAGIIAWCLGSFGIPRQRWIILLAPFLAAYIFMTGAQPSAIRAGLMAAIYYAAPFLGRRSDTLNAIAAAVLVLLAVDPSSAEELGFIMSFAMVTGLVLLLPATQNLLGRLLRVEKGREALAIDRVATAPHGFRGKFAFFVSHLGIYTRLKLHELLPAAVAASLVSFPLTSYFFGFCSPYALLANVVVVPLASVVMVVTAVGLALSCLHPLAAVPANLAAGALAWAMKSVSVGVASLPGAAPKLHFSLPALATWYAALLLCAAFLRDGSSRSRMTG